MSAFFRLLNQTAIYGVSSIVGRLLNYLLVPLYTRYFLPNEYGVVVELYSYVGFFLVVLTFGLETAFFRFASKMGDYKRVFSTILFFIAITSITFIILGLMFARPLADVMRYTANIEYIVYFVLIIGVDAFTAIPFAKLRQQNRPIKFAIVRIINIIINIGLNLFFIVLCPYLLKFSQFQWITLFYSPSVGVGYIFISNLAASIVTLLMLSTEMRCVPFVFDKKLFRQLIKYGLPLIIIGLTGMVNETIDRILLKYLLVVPAGVADSHSYIMAQLGIYGASYKISIFMTLFIQAFRYAAEPFFFSQYKKQDAKKMYADVSKYFIVFGLLIFLFVTLFIDFIKFFIDELYYEGLVVVPILLIANLFLGVLFNLSIAYKLTDKTHYGAYIGIFGALITIVLNVLFIPIYGYIASAWATFICYFAMMIVSYFVGQKVYEIKYDLRKIFSYVSVAFALFVFNNYIYSQMLVVETIINFIFLCIFVGFIIITDYKNVKKIIKPKLQNKL